MKGRVSHLVNTFGSTWGRLQQDDASRQVFFDPRSMAAGSSYAELVLGEVVEFDEEPDRANGSHAVNVRPSAAEGAGVLAATGRTVKEIRHE